MGVLPKYFHMLNMALETEGERYREREIGRKREREEEEELKSEMSQREYKKPILNYPSLLLAICRIAEPRISLSIG